jgi:adenylate cyclase
MARPPRRRAIRFVIAVLLTITNLAGAAVVFLLAAFVVPLPGGGDNQVRLLNLAVLAAYVPAAVVVGTFWGVRRQRHIDWWLVEKRPATDREKRALLRTPDFYAWMHLALWGFASLLFGAINVPSNVGRAALVVAIVAITGVTVAALSFLIVERRIRPITRAALETGLPERRKAGHVSVRVTMAWLLGTGAATTGLILSGLMAIVLGADATSFDQLGATMISLGAVIILVGGLVTFLAARATADPILALRTGFARVGRGRLDTWVAIDDGTEIGELQAGFNDMVAGLREREQLRDLFGRHVGVDVAREALANGVRLGGEIREVTVLFVDVMGSTTMATELDPDRGRHAAQPLLRRRDRRGPPARRVDQQVRGRRGARDLGRTRRGRGTQRPGPRSGSRARCPPRSTRCPRSPQASASRAARSSAATSARPTATSTP